MRTGDQGPPQTRTPGRKGRQAKQHEALQIAAHFRSRGCNRKIKAIGEWLSLVEHLVRDQGVGGSNPLSPTNIFNSLQTGVVAPGIGPGALGQKGASL